jgi:acetolactate synthase I/II/III large subunit
VSAGGPPPRTGRAGSSTVAEVIAGAIAGRAADRVFTFPGGGSNLELIDALERCGVRVVLARSEGGAALMAATYADLVQRPSVVVVGLGPGIASVINGVAHAMLDQSPVIVISDRFTEAELHSTGHQLLDQTALLGPVVKWQATISAEEAGAAVGQALTIACTPPRGAVHLELPRDVASAPASPGPLNASADDPANGRPANTASLSAATAALVGAHRPVVLIGDEALNVPQSGLLALLEQVEAPALCTYKAKGALPEDHGLWCGIVTNGALESPLLGEADAVLAVGLDPVELLPAPWRVRAPVIALREHDEPAPGYGPEHTLLGGLAPLVRALHAGLGETSSTWSRSEIAELRAEQLAAVRIGSADSLSALEVVEAVQAMAPDATVTVDAGAHMFAATWGWRATRPRRFLISNGHATMGYAVPAAIAAAIARPGEPVIAFTGDGGFLLHANELETAVRTGAKLLVVVLNDSSLSLIRIKQEERRYRRAAVDFGPVDAAALGRALGAIGITARTAAEVRAGVDTALGQTLPAVLDVRISGSEYGELQRVLRVTGAPGGARRGPLCVG